MAITIIFLLITLLFLTYILILLYYKKNISNKLSIIESSFLIWILFIFLINISGFFQPVVKEQPFLGEGVEFVGSYSSPDYTLQIVGTIIFWLSLILFIITTICISKERRKSIIKWGLIGLFASVFIFGILKSLPSSFTKFLGRLIFIGFFNSSERMGDGAIILIYILPFYGAIAGSTIGFIISSLKDNKKFYQKSGFYLFLVLSIIMLTSAILPIRTSDSFNEPSLYRKNICEKIQGCNYLESEKLCAGSDLPYPRTPLNDLPSEIIYTCDAFNINSAQLTEKDLVGGKCPIEINGEIIYLEPYPHPLYLGYHLKNNKIYIRDELCGEAGKFRYIISCNC